MTEPGIEVRTADGRDTAWLSSIASSAAADVSDRRGGAEAAAVDLDDADEVLVATVGGQQVGFVGLDAAPPTCTLRALYVGVPYREVGVGAALLDAVIAWAAERGCDRIDAWALPGDRDTKNFFETHGLTARQIIVQRIL